MLDIRLLTQLQCLRFQNREVTGEIRIGFHNYNIQFSRKDKARARIKWSVFIGSDPSGAQDEDIKGYIISNDIYTYNGSKVTYTLDELILCLIKVGYSEDTISYVRAAVKELYEYAKANPEHYSKELNIC